MSEPKEREREEAMALMKRYQEGDHTAFESLAELLGPSVFRFFTHSFRDRATAEDLYQETWLKVHHARHTYRPGEPVLPWLFGIARHVAADNRRRYARHMKRVDAVERAAQVASDVAVGGAAPAADRAEAAQLLDLAMDGLPENQREALFLLKVEGLSVQEAAEVAGTSPGALKVRAHRAYARIRERVAELLGETSEET